MAVFANSLKDSPHLTAIVVAAETYLKSWDSANWLMYLVNICPASALPELAGQFDVLGWKGWNIAKTEQERRNLIRTAIKLHKYKGTPYSIKEALKSVGFGGATINEGATVGVVRDGTWKYNGFLKHDSAYWHNWAFFQVVVNLGETKGITDDETAIVLELINEYKPARCVFEGVTFDCTVSDLVYIEESFELEIITA